MNSDMKKRKTLKIACCSVPFSGHMNPIISLVKGLVSKRDNSKDFNYEICVFTFGEDGSKKYQKQCDELNVDINVSHIDGLHTNKDMEKLAGKIIFPTIANKWESTLENELDKFHPNIIVCDLMTLNPQEYAHKHNITLVANTPGPISLLSPGSMPSIPTFTQPVNLEGNGINGFAFAFGGLYISFKKLDLFGFLLFFNINDLGTMAKRVQSNVFGSDNTIVLVNSFWGLEEPRLFVPPNIMMVGPVMPPLSTKPDFSKTHPKLNDFLLKARSENKKVLLVSTGSIICMEKWLVQLLYNAFCNIKLNNNKTDIAIVWSLKQDQQEFIDSSTCDRNKFYFSSWLPQPSLLASDYIDGVITHCGWGGTLECIAGGKPIGTFRVSHFTLRSLLMLLLLLLLHSYTVTYLILFLLSLSLSLSLSPCRYPLYANMNHHTCRRVTFFCGSTRECTIIIRDRLCNIIRTYTKILYGSNWTIIL
jgi:hypothetical protein